MIGRRIIGVATCAVVGAGLGLAVGTLVPSRYTASAQIIVDPIDRTAGRGEPDGAEPSAALAARVENQVRMLTSELVLRRLVASQRLDEDPEFDGSPESGVLARVANAVHAMTGTGEPKAASPTRAAVRTLQRDVSALREERSTVVTVSATAGEPHKAMVLADGLVSAFVAETAEAREAAALKAAGAFDERLSDAKRALDASERRLEDRRRRETQAGQGVRDAQLAAASERLDRARTASAEASARYQGVLKAQRADDADLVPEALGSPALTALRSRLAEVRRRVADLTATRGPRHPEVIEIRARETAIRRPLVEEIARTAAQARAVSEKARDDERRAEKGLDGLKIAQAPGDPVARQREAEREVDAARSLHDALLARSRDAAERERAGAADIRVISNALPPERRTVPPPTPILVLGGLGLGLLLGAASAVLLGRTSARHRRPARPSPGRAIVRD